MSFLTSAVLIVIGALLAQVMTEYLRSNAYNITFRGGDAIYPLVAAALVLGVAPGKYSRPIALGEQSKQHHTLEREIKALRKDVKQKDLVIEKLEADLQDYRMQPFLKEDFKGVRQYDRVLITILKEGRRIATGELLRRLDIDPTQTELMQAVNHQLEQLEAYGLVTGTTHGWRWVE